MEFCPNCGQKNRDYRYAFFGLIGELFQESLNFDTQLITTLQSFLLTPGKISADVVAGKRKRYTPPFRLFLFSSFVIVFLLNIWASRGFDQVQASDAFGKLNTAIAPNKMLDGVAQKILVLDSIEIGEDTLQLAESLLKKNAKTQNDSLILLAFNELKGNNKIRFRIKKRSDSVAYLAPFTTEESDSAMVGDSKIAIDDYVDWVKNKPQKMDSIYQAQNLGYSDRLAMRLQDELQVVFVHSENNERLQYAKEHGLSFLSRITYPILFLLPISSLLLLLLFGRKRKYYYEHFIFNIHLHTAFNIMNIVVVLLAWGISVWNDAVPIVLFILTYFVLAPLYTLFSMRYFYKDTWVKVLVKFHVFAVLYYILIIFGLLLFLLLELAYF